MYHTFSITVINKLIKVFTRREIVVCDSTIISLPDKLKNTYKGMGGRNSNSALKIQAVYSIINHRLRKMELTSRTSSDRKYTNTIIEMMNPLDLVIFDLGYFSTKSFEDIIDNNGYFISRIKTNTVFYIESITENEEFDKINLLDVLNKSNVSVLKRQDV